MKSVTLILFGGTGDLARKKILPALSGLIKRGVIDRINLVPTGRRPLSNDEYKKITGFKRRKGIIVNYLQMDFTKDGIGPLRDMLRRIEDDSCIGRLFYFAITPEYFETLAEKLAGLERNGFNRLIFEKPFGYDLGSSIELNRLLTKYFDEKDIFRVDHYLGKETVRNILALRLSNPFFERTWNSRFIESINVIVSEDMGVGNRMDYYNNSGAIRDMIQNHMLQILSFILMDVPDSSSYEDVHRKKLSALNSLSYERVVTGQYRGYAGELRSRSDTETYVNLELSSSLERWKDARISLITGKRLDKKYALIELNYRKEPCIIYCDIDTVPNRLVINVQPKEDVDFYLNVPIGLAQDVKNVKMNFCKECEFSESAPESYEVVLEECIKGEKTIFIDSKELEYAWRLVDSIRSDLPRPVMYDAGTDALSVA